MKKLLYTLCIFFCLQSMEPEVITLKFVDEYFKPLRDQSGKEVTDTLEKKYIKLLPTLKNMYALQEEIGARGGKVDISDVIPVQVNPQDWQLFKKTLPYAEYGYGFYPTALRDLLNLYGFEQLVSLAQIAMYFGQEIDREVWIENWCFLRTDEPLATFIERIVSKFSDKIHEINDEAIRDAAFELKSLRDKFRP